MDSCFTGAIYSFQWSPDLVTWQSIGEPVTAGSSVLQFVDSGPPGTPSLPGPEPCRFYRVIRVF